MNYQKLNVFSKIICFLFFCELLTTTKSFDAEPRIIGGYECIYEEIPYVVEIFITDGDSPLYTCDGSLISLEWILTAAHCIDQNSISNNTTLARTGFHYKKVTPQKRYVQKGIRYSKYNKSNHHDPRYDIGLMLLDKAFDETNLVKSGTLAAPGFSSQCINGTAAGTGIIETENYTALTSETDPFNETLFCLDLPILTIKLCKEVNYRLIAPNIDDSIICTMSKEKKSPCEGDSGGPLSCKGVIIGVTSGTIECGEPDTPSFYQAVESYLNFIAETTNIGTYETVTEIERAQSSHASSVEKGNCNKLGIVRSLLIIGVFITLAL